LVDLPVVERPGAALVPHLAVGGDVEEHGALDGK
jgi:hypothetical protein